MKKMLYSAFLGVVLAGLVSPALAEPVTNRITVTIRGKGPDVILIPGLACSTAVWDATVAHLEANYRLHVIQLAGFAGSPASANAEGPVIQPTVDAVDTYIKTNGLRSPKVIGHSLGGLMGLLLAAQHPEDISKVLVVDSLPFFGAEYGAKDAKAVEPQAAAVRDTLLHETQDAYAQSERQFLPSLVKSPEGLKQVIAWAVASDKSVVARAMYDDLTTDLRPKLPQIKTPVTVLYPWDSASGMPQATVDRLYGDSFAALPNKTLVRIDNSLHFIMLDQPGALAAQVDAFVK